MPEIEVAFYRDDDGSVPLIEWLDTLQAKAQGRCLAKLQMLEEYGHELRRPAAEYLGGDIYELRVKFFEINYRMLYFFHERRVAVISPGVAKEREAPPRGMRP